MTTDDSAAPKPLTDRVMAVVRASAAGCPLSQIQDEFPEVDPKEVRAVLTTLRNQKLLIGGMSEGEPFYKTPGQCPQTQPGTALRPVRAASDAKPSEASRGPVPGDATEPPVAPRRFRAPRKTAQSTNEGKTDMPPKGKHDTESHRGAIRRAVLKALGESGDKQGSHALQNLLSPQRRLSARQMSNALAALKVEGLAKSSGRGPGTTWEITSNGVAALGAPVDEAAPPKPPKKAGPGGTKKLTASESREVALLVLAFDSAGLLAKAA